jgi:hypothetical protein
MTESFGMKTKKKTKDEDHEFPMQIPYIAKMQDKDKSLKELMKSDNKYELTKIERTLVLTINGKIFIPTAIRQKVIAWYHEYLCHPGTTRTKATIWDTMAWPGLTRNVQTYCKTCKLCQFNKKTRKQYGKFPVKQAETKPWGTSRYSWTLGGKKPSGTKALRCFTAIDPAT